MLRDYQKKTIELCKKAYQDGKRKILVVLPTGAGKTVIFIEQMRKMVANHHKVLVVTRRKSIVAQTRARVSTELGFPAGMYMGAKTSNLDAPIVVSSIDTIGSRIKRQSVRDWLKSFTVIIIDEAHDTTSTTYVNMLEVIKGGRAVSVVGYTATPYRIGNKGHTYWDCCVVPIKPHELRDDGWLAPLDIYSPANIDTRKVSITAGDYNQKELYHVVNQKKIYGNILHTYEKLAKGKSALVFCVNKEHSRQVAETFKNHGYNAEHCDCGTTMGERLRVINFMRQSITEGKPFILCNVNIFSTGIDIPEVGVCIQARPTASKVLYIQQVGRVLRINQHKGKALLIDHGGNAMRFGSPYTYHQPELTDKARGSRKADTITSGWRCKKCFFFQLTPQTKCPSCGHQAPLVVPKESEEDLIQLHAADLKSYKRELYFIQEALMNKGKSPDYAFYTLHNKHGSKVIEFLIDLDCPKPIRDSIIARNRALRGINEKRASNFSQTKFYE